MDERGVEYTFLWCIPDHSYLLWEKYELQSPVFRADELQGTSWRIKVYPRGKRDECKGYISLYLGRDSVDDGPEEISVNYELSVLAADGLTPHSKVAKQTFEKSTVCGWPRFLEIEDFREDRADILIVCARIWKGEGKVCRVAPIFARSRIAVENISFIHAVRNVSTLHAYERIREKIQLESQKFFVRSDLSVTDDQCWERWIFGRYNPSYSKPILCKIKMFLLDAFGNLVCVQNDNRFDFNRRKIQKQSFLFPRQSILSKKRDYLPYGKLSLLCETAFVTKITEEVIENIELEMSTKADKETGKFVFLFEYTVKLR